MLLAPSWRRTAIRNAVHVAFASAIVCFLTVNAGRATAAQGDPVYFAGVAYTGDAADISQAYPHIARALSSGGSITLDQDVRRQIQSEALPMNVAFDALGSIKDSSKSTALALGIDRETTSVEHIGNVYKLRVEVAAEALFFDFKEKQVLGGFPFTIDYIDASATAPTDEDIQKAFQGVLFGAPGQHSLALEFGLTLAHAHVPNASNKHLRVTSVTLAPKAVDYVHQYAPQVDVATMPLQVAEAFGKYLGANQEISILPYSGNQALGSSMAARFIEGDAYQLKIPEADYEIHLNLAGFKKINQSQTAINTLLLYGAFVDVTVLEPLSGKIYFSQRIKQGEPKTIPVTQTSLDDWSPTYETLLILFDNFTRSLSQPHNDWSKSGLPNSTEARDQLTSLGELVQSCR